MRIKQMLRKQFEKRKLRILSRGTQLAYQATNFTNLLSERTPCFTSNCSGKVARRETQNECTLLYLLEREKLIPSPFYTPYWVYVSVGNTETAQKREDGMK